MQKKEGRTRIGGKKRNRESKEENRKATKN